MVPHLGGPFVGPSPINWERLPEHCLEEDFEDPLCLRRRESGDWLVTPPRATNQGAATIMLLVDISVMEALMRRNWTDLMTIIYICMYPCICTYITLSFIYINIHRDIYIYIYLLYTSIATIFSYGLNTVLNTGVITEHQWCGLWPQSADNQGEGRCL